MQLAIPFIEVNCEGKASDKMNQTGFFGMKDVSGMVLEILRFFCLQEGWLSHPEHLDCLKLQKQSEG